MKLAN